MTQPTPAHTRRCRDCDGFPVVHIDTGTQHPDGTRLTIPVVCRACDGTGRRRVTVRSSTRAGR
ncbi:hypothetical protein MMF93_24390 [Streptomyces tubbatahanensis]|uniref:Molecular chaperone DnaJ n=1 Tax=Streptomyces tubbatahanensis TaxID=2923272 RepID=A0ABY3XXZ3_9ACTN|nr:hypothetical protein [Streptomyces tubbatahanensis]UNS99245.1 hypothetical protein MMF93_24390 [Streptomyces tubbatahanensis]